MRSGSLLITLALTVVLTGCSDEPESEPVESTQPSTETTTEEPDPGGDPVQFRVVEYSDTAQPPTHEAPWAELDDVDCDAVPPPSVPTPADRPILACSGEEKLALGPAEIVGGVVDAEASVPEGQTDWAVELQLDDEASGEFARLGEQLVEKAGRLAIVVDGRVLSAPVMNGVITDGRVQIAGAFTEPEAEELADRLEAAP